jgi:hypothetical protein
MVSKALSAASFSLVEFRSWMKSATLLAKALNETSHNYR